MKRLFIILCATFGLLGNNAFAWEPDRMISAYSPFSPGSGNEIAFRIVTKEIEAKSKIKFQVVHKPGAGGSLANQLINKHVGDGYTVGILSAPTLGATDKIMLPNKEYSVTDFSYVLNISSIPMTIVTVPEDPVNNISDLAKVLKTEKTVIGDPGSAARLVYELLVQHIGFVEGPENIVRVEYKGPADTLKDVMGKQIRFGIMPLTIAYENHKAGKVKIIAVTSEKEIPTLPGVKTAAYMYPDFVFNLDIGIVLPPNTPKDIVSWYEKTFKTALNSTDVRKSLELQMMFVDNKLLSPENYTKYMVSYAEKYSRIVDKVIATINSK